MTLLQQHKKSNKMINENVSLEEYSKMRQERDKALRAPRYIHPSIQVSPCKKHSMAFNDIVFLFI